ELAAEEARSPRPVVLREIPEPEGYEEPEVDGVPLAPSIAPPARAGPLVASPNPTASFKGLDDVNDYAPPDTNGAVGPNHVVTVTNSRIRIFSRPAFGAVSTQTLNGFWSSVLPGGTAGVFDPHLVYDPYGNRWIIAAVSDSRNANSSV